MSGFKKFRLSDGGMTLEGIFAKIMEEGNSEEESVRTKVRRGVLPDVLAYQYFDHCRRLTTPQPQFKVGDLITWKPGMRSHKWPVAGEPVVVTMILDQTVYETVDKNHGTPYWREPMDIKIGWIDPEGGEFLEFHADSRRYLLWTPDMMEDALQASE